MVITFKAGVELKLGTHYPCPWTWVSKMTPVTTGHGHCHGVKNDTHVHGPWTRVSFFDTRVHGPCLKSEQDRENSYFTSRKQHRVAAGSCWPGDRKASWPIATCFRKPKACVWETRPNMDWEATTCWQPGTSWAVCQRT